MAYLVGLFLVMGGLFTVLVCSIAIGTMIPAAALAGVGILVVAIRRYYQSKNEWPNAKVKTRKRSKDSSDKK